jgi:signal peptidase I
MQILSNILYGLFILMLLSVAGLFLATLLPIPGNIQVKIVKSGSMEPTIHTGAIVVVKPQVSYSTGDIITFGEDTTKQIPTTHRIVTIREEAGTAYYATKGDANEDPDSQEITTSEIIGSVLFSVPSAGYILDFARTPVGFVLLIGLPALLIVFDESMRIVREISIMRENRRRKPSDIRPERIRPTV